MVHLDGHSLTIGSIAMLSARTDYYGAMSLGAAEYAFDLDAAALERMRVGRAALLSAAEDGRVYGMTTGVGANVGSPVPENELAGHALRVLHSHSAAYGPDESAGVVRASILVRLNQLLVGSSGVRVELAQALQELLASGGVPRIGSFGTIGTADLTQLAQVGLALAGEGDWLVPCIDDPPRWSPHPGEALALISSSAFTLARAAICLYQWEGLVRSARVVAALTFIALRGSGQAYAAEAFDPKLDPFANESAAELRSLLGVALDRPGVRLQDVISLRSFPQVDSVVRAAAKRAGEVVTGHINSGRENPMVGVSGAVLHHGQFYSGDLAGALDALRAGDVPFAEAADRRLSTMLDPRRTALSAFLADRAPGSSGLMILEYVAADALGEVRLAGVNVPSAAVVSDGIEDLASFAPHGVRLLERQTHAMRTVIGCELVAAIRLLRMAPERQAPGRLAAAFAYADAALDIDLTDRPLTADIEIATALLHELANYAQEPAISDTMEIEL